MRKIAAMPNATPDQKSAIDDQISEISAAARAKLAEAVKASDEAGVAAAEKFAAPFKSAFDRLGGSLESGVAGLLEHKETARKAAMSLRDSMITSGVDTVGTGLSKAGGALLHGKEGQGIGDVLGDKLGSWIAQIVAQITATTGNTAALMGNTAGLAAAASVSGVSAGSSAAGSAGGIFGSLSAVYNTIFGGAAKSVGIASLSAGGVVPRYSLGGVVHAAGGWGLPSGTDTVRAWLTPGEVVLNRGQQEDVKGAMRGAAAGAGGGGDSHFHAHFHGPADGPAVSRWFKQNLRQNAGALADLMRSRVPM
jgi:hypothetical protein